MYNLSHERTQFSYIIYCNCCRQKAIARLHVLVLAMWSLRLGQTNRICMWVNVGIKQSVKPSHVCNPLLGFLPTQIFNILCNATHIKFYFIHNFSERWNL